MSFCFSSMTRKSGYFGTLGNLFVVAAGFIDVAEGDDVLAGDVVEVGAALPPQPMTAMLRRSMGPAGAAGAPTPPVSQGPAATALARLFAGSDGGVGRT